MKSVRDVLGDPGGAQETTRTAITLSYWPPVVGGSRHVDPWCSGASPFPPPLTSTFRFDPDETEAQPRNAAETEQPAADTPPAPLPG